MSIAAVGTGGAMLDQERIIALAARSASIDEQINALMVQRAEVNEELLAAAGGESREKAGNKTAGATAISYGDLVDPVELKDVAGIVGSRPDNMLRNLKSNNMPVVKVGKTWRCQAQDAAALWPKYRAYLKKKAEF